MTDLVLSGILDKVLANICYLYWAESVSACESHNNQAVKKTQPTYLYFAPAHRVGNNLAALYRLLCLMRHRIAPFARLLSLLHFRFGILIDTGIYFLRVEIRQ